MKNAKQNIENGSIIVSQAFEECKRKCEKAMNSGGDYSAELMDCSTMVSYSVVKKLLDPQHKNAVEMDKVSDSGQNKALLAIRSGIGHDTHLLANTRRNAEKATATRYNDNGDLVTEIVDKAANAACEKLIAECLTDGIDLVQEAAVLIIEYWTKYGDNENWLDMPIQVRKLDKRVAIQDAKSAAFKWVDTTPMREIFIGVRQLIEGESGKRLTANSKYIYIDETVSETIVDENGESISTLETYYRRLSKYADIGGYDCHGLYTADKRMIEDCENILEKLKLTDRQAEVIDLRMRGWGYQAIATYLGVGVKNIKRTRKEVERKCLALGFTPSMYDEMTNGDNNLNMDEFKTEDKK